MKYTKLGNSDLVVSSIGLGCMGMSEFYGTPPDERESIKTIIKAIDYGVNFIDTSDVYGNGHNEELIGKALQQCGKDAIVATKFGVIKKQGEYKRTVSGDPKYVKASAKASLKRLKRNYIDLYYIHRVDATIPIEETIGAMSDLVKQGLVRYIGISEASIETIRKAHKVHPLSAVQTEYSLFTRDVEHVILPEIQRLGISLVAYSPLGRGYLTGKLQIQSTSADIRNQLPRFQGDNRKKNDELAKTFIAIAEDLKITPSQLALAWLLNNNDNIIPIPGTTKIDRLLENIRAADIQLEEDIIEKLNGVFSFDQVVGNRYPSEGMIGINE